MEEGALDLEITIDTLVYYTYFRGVYDFILEEDPASL
jgi:hypothetical protein